MLRCIDIASHQRGIVTSQVDCDVVIIKVTGGNWYVNPYWREWADDALASGKQIGLYHYAREGTDWHSANDEARFFLDHVSDFRGKYVPILDWEAEALGYPNSWAREWLDTVARETGSTPMFYGYASNVNSRDYSEIAGYPLWMASYLDRYDGAGWVDDPYNSWPTGSWERMACYQYTSTGHVSGYDGRLDLSVFYGNREDWTRLQGGNMPTNADLVDLLMPVSTRYVFGGTRYDIYDTDCSGIVCGAFYRVFGLDPYTLGDWTGAQWSRGALAKLWWGTTPNLPWDSMQKGDVIFTSNCSPDFSTNNGSHVGFYTGDPARPFLSHYANGGPYVTAVNGVYGNECYYGVARYKKGVDDMRPADIWEYDYDESAVGGNMYNALNGTAQAILLPHESATGDGTNGSMRDRIEYIDMRVREIKEAVEELKNAPKVSIGGMDYGKLAKAVADELYARMAQ